MANHVKSIYDGKQVFYWCNNKWVIKNVSISKIALDIHKLVTAWKVSVFRVFWFVFSHIRSEYGQIQSKKPQIRTLFTQWVVPSLGERKDSENEKNISARNVQARCKENSGLVKNNLRKIRGQLAFKIVGNDTVGMILCNTIVSYDVISHYE